ncbi:hypothetical protein FACS189419_09690 [Planctomycetales bacterium]|nr:hypothetical protein FACS189419_09690 [Planctomycetales bacterium]
MQLSLIIPVYNEAESLTQLHSEIVSVVAANNYDAEIIFVDDGSSDNSWKTLRQLAETDSRMKAIRFRRNFGKAAALQAGIDIATGKYLLTLDADLQDDPKEIPGFLKQMEQDYGVISGWKKERHDPWHKVYPSRCFNGMVSRLTGVKLHDHNCGMKCYRREVFEEVSLYGEMHRFIPVLAAARGFKVGEKVIEHRKRQFGHSKYGFARFIKGFLDLLTVWFLTRYGQRPHHFFGTVGLVMMGLFLLLTIASDIQGGIVEAATYYSPTHTQILRVWAAVISVGINAVWALYLTAVIFLLGLSCELQVFYKKPKNFSIKEVINA